MNIKIPKATGTYADALQAVGTASLLFELSRVPAQIRDEGDSFAVTCDGGMPPEHWEPPLPGFLFIWRESKDGARPPGPSVIDYEGERATNEILNKTRASKKARAAVRQAVEETSEAPLPELHSEYRLAAIIESMRKGWESDKDLYRWIAEHPAETLQWARDRLTGATAGEPLSLSNSQILNPSTGKGVHATKAVASSAGSIPKALIDPFAEWMKLRGLYAAMLPYRSGDDFKFFVIEPGDITSSHVEMVRRDLRRLNLWGEIRLDIEAILRLLAILVQHSEANDGEISFFNDTPRRVVRGLRQAYFKSLGTAAALMNDALLPLPDWFAVETKDDVDAYIRIAEEPYGVPGGKGGPLSTLRDDRSDDVPILQAYRLWLASGQLPALLEFHALFAVHVISRYGANDFVRPFSAEILDLLLQRLRRYPHVKEIVTNDGFRSVARAIRNTTIYAAGMKNSNREVRFGLAQKWKQRIKAGDTDFLATLAEFVQEQNWEVVHRLGGKGHVVTESDLNEVVVLVQKYHAELVGMLLLAYGYARAERTGTPEEEVETPQAEAV